MIRAQVCAFHAAFGFPIVLAPSVPGSERIELRIKLIGEEFCELLDALGVNPEFVEAVEDAITDARWRLSRTVDLVEVADALADLDYVVEGTRLEFGIDGSLIADEVHRSNMSKIGGSVRSDGKVLKPANWSAPDIRGELIRQGWAP